MLPTQESLTDTLRQVAGGFSLTQVLIYNCETWGREQPGTGSQAGSASAEAAIMNAASAGQADVKVSVHMITYNHERFIAQAIEGVLMQQTDFAVELVIGEDCSTDGTRAIVRRYGERYPERIRLLLQERNLGARANALATLNACRGQYIALCEGDDYWTDPTKLQKQVDFLESHPECSLCFHRVLVVYEDGSARSTGIRP